MFKLSSFTPRASALGILALLAQAVACACGTVQPSEPVSLPLASSDAALLRAHLARVHSTFLQLDAPLYRSQVIELIGSIDHQTEPERLSRFAIILDEVARGGDGLEPVALAYADAFAHSGSAAGRATAMAGLQSTRARYRHTRPFPAMLVPLGRSHSRVFVDVRADAARVLLDGLLGNPGALDLDQLQGLPSVRTKACGLPALTPEVRAAYPDLDAADQRRTEDCIRSGGGEGGSGDLLGALEASSCLDAIGPDAFALSDSYTSAEMGEDLEACLDTLGSSNPTRGVGRDRPAVGPLAPVILRAVLYLGSVVVPILIERGIDVVFGDEDEAAPPAPTPTPSASPSPGGGPTNDGAGGTGGEGAGNDAAVAAADAAVASALTDEANAKKAHDDAVAATRAAASALAGTGLSDAERAARQAEYDDSQRREKEAAEVLAQARKRRQQKEDDAVQARAKNGDGTEPADPLNSEACQRLLGGGRPLSERLHLDQDSADARVWHEQKRARAVNPRPDDEPVTAGEVMFLPSCDGDSSLVGRTPGLSCDAVAMCRDPGEQCGCRPDIEPRSTSMIVAARTMMCGAVIRCDEGERPVSSGQGCACSSGEAPGGARPRPAPVGAALQRMTAPSAEQARPRSFTRLVTDLMRRDGGRAAATR